MGQRILGGASMNFDNANNMKSKTEAEHFLKENDASVEDCMNLLVGICFYPNGLGKKAV